MRIIIVLLLINFGVCSCSNNNSIKEKIKGVWIFGVRKNVDHPEYKGLRLATLYDFRDNGKLYFKKYGWGDTILNWKIDVDSILTIDTLQYEVKSILDNRLVLIEKKAKESFITTYNRPEDIFISKSEEEIKNILLSNTWTTTDPKKFKWYSNFEFFDNHIMIYRYKFLDRNFKDTMNNIQIETWTIDKYKNYTFLVNYVKNLSNGNFRNIKQISEINQNSYSLIDRVQGDKTEKFISNKQSNKRDTLSKLIKGNWISKNLKSNNYGNIIPKHLVTQGKTALFEGNLKLNVSEDKLNYQVDTFPPVEYNWTLGREGKTLLLEYEVKEPYYEGVIVKYADIQVLTKNKLKLRLFDNNFYTGKEKPNRYLLNLIQNFERKN